MKNITKAQANILRYLLSFGEIRQRDGGFFAEEEGWRVSIKAVNGLIDRDLLRVNRTHTLPSSGLMASPVLDNNSVTKEGIEALLNFIHHISWDKRTGVWYKVKEKIQRGIDEAEDENEKANENTRNPISENNVRSFDE